MCSTETVLHSFNSTADGYQPSGPLVADARGNLYGTTYNGGFYAQGTVYELTPNSDGTWRHTVLHSFKGGSDGLNPSDSGLVMDSAGNLYGTTLDGGDEACIGTVPGCGTVFELSPNPQSGFTFSTIHLFKGGSDGANPDARLVLDSNGNLYGTTDSRDAFELTPASGGWTERVIYRFPPEGGVATGLVLDSAGNLYGATQGEGHSLGTVFELSPSSEGTWKENVLHVFSGSGDGAYPAGPLVFDTAGNLYGATQEGGSSGCFSGCGRVFELKPNGSGVWAESILHDFQNGNGDGVNPNSFLVFDSAGNLYGTTKQGGYGTGGGVVFRLAPSTGGQWTETVVHAFTGGVDGYPPTDAGVLIDPQGNLYGATTFGGLASSGTVFKLCPSAGSWKKTTLYAFPSTDAGGPLSTLVADSAGNWYGTTQGGGAYGQGAVFKLTLMSRGDWMTSVIYSFKGSPDGSLPLSGLAIDAAGNLYGTTYYGGTGSNCSGASCGIVYELSPSSNGGLKETVLYNFLGGTDGANPDAPLVFDKNGNLFGTTPAGGDSGCSPESSCGTIFELSSPGGTWTESVIYRFTGGPDNGIPGPVTIDAAGNIYGVTKYMGCDGCFFSFGTIFELAPNAGSGWSLSTLYSFTGGNDGDGPNAVTLDSAGNLYGTTVLSGTFDGGTVFEMKHTNAGWTEQTIYTFTLGSDGGRPNAGVVFDSTGNLYGTTYTGGNMPPVCRNQLGCGVVYKLTPGAGGWTETTLHAFNSSPADGAYPEAEVAFDAAGNLYGTTWQGGVVGAGTVFEIKP